jgi:mRNA interferase MazF
VTYNTFDIVTVPFPFTDNDQAKRRPALILSSAKNFNIPSGHSVMATITSAKNNSWPLDIEILDLKKAGLPSPSIIRMKIFTIDQRLIIDKIGSLSKQDRLSLVSSFNELFLNLNALT